VGVHVQKRTPSKSPSAKSKAQAAVADDDEEGEEEDDDDDDEDDEDEEEEEEEEEEYGGKGKKKAATPRAASKPAATAGSPAKPAAAASRQGQDGDDDDAPLSGQLARVRAPTDAALAAFVDSTVRTSDLDQLTTSTVVAKASAHFATDLQARKPAIKEMITKVLASLGKAD
jgi:hypothetical protein